MYSDKDFIPGHPVHKLNFHFQNTQLRSSLLGAYETYDYDCYIIPTFTMSSSSCHIKKCPLLTRFR